MKKNLITLLIMFTATVSYANSALIEGFEYANHDGETPVGWVCSDNSWLAGYLDKDHNRTPHTGNWYAYTNADDSWMFMELFMSTEIKYRYNFWAISDGEYDVEFWAGSGPSVSEMTTMLFTQTVNSDEYHRLSEYIDMIAVNYQYFGIHAIAHEGAYHLTIDDIMVDLVGKYDIDVTPISMDTIMMPGGRVAFHYTVQNTGYEPLHIYMNGYSDYFTDIDFYEDGMHYSSFPTEPNQSVEAVCYATLKPDVEMGSRCWVDIMFTVSCDCVTRMATIWATVGMDGIEENVANIGIYPNPSNGSITIEGNGTVTISNVLGQEIIKKQITDKETVSLESGVYFVKINEVTKKVIIR